MMLAWSGEVDQKTTACREHPRVPRGFLKRLPALCQGAGEPRGTSRASVMPQAEGKEGKREEFLLKVLKDPF